MTNPPKRRNYLVNPHFQIKWTLIITFVGVISAGLFASVLWISIDNQTGLLHKLDEFDKRGIEYHQELMVQLLNQPDRTDKERERFEKNFNVAKEDLMTRKSTRDQLMALNGQLKYYIIIFVILIGVGLFIWGIFLTHRVAGPLFVLQKVLQNFEESGQLGARPLRKGDEFQETYQAMVECLTHIASSRTQEIGNTKPTDRP
jgi:hypothetical protein